MDENNMNIDDRIYKVCQNAEYEFSKSQKNNINRNQSIGNGISSINNPMTFNKFSTINNVYNSETNDDLKENMNAGLNESYSKLARINNKSIDTDINVLSKIKFGVKNEKENNLKNILFKLLY